MLHVVDMDNPTVSVSITREEYDALDALNWSKVKLLDHSPAVYLKSLRPSAGPDPEHFVFGRLFHAATLEPDKLDGYAVFEGTRRGKVWDAFQEDNAGREIVRAADMFEAQALARAVREHPIAGPIFADGEAEVTVLWSADGIARKARLDWVQRLPGGGRMVWDLKHTRSTALHDFERQAAGLLYHGQMAWYADGLACAAGVEEPVPAGIIAVERATRDVAVFPYSEDALSAGARLAEGLLEKYRKVRDGAAHGRYTERVTLNLPRWMQDDEGEAEGLIYGTAAE